MEANIFYIKQKSDYVIIGVTGYSKRKFAGIACEVADDGNTAFLKISGTSIPKGIEIGSKATEITSIKDGVIEWAK